MSVVSRPPVGVRIFAMPKSSNFGHAFRRDQDVAGLEIAMNHQVLVRVVNRSADGQKQFKPASNGERMDFAVGIDGRSLDQLHHEIGNAVVGGAAIEQARDVGMIETGKDLPFMAKAFKNELRESNSATHQLDRNFPVKFAISANRAIDLAHATVADFLEDVVGTNTPAGALSPRSFEARQDAAMAGSRRKLLSACRIRAQQ